MRLCGRAHARERQRERALRCLHVGTLTLACERERGFCPSPHTQRKKEEARTDDTNRQKEYAPTHMRVSARGQ